MSVDSPVEVAPVVNATVDPTIGPPEYAGALANTPAKRTRKRAEGPIERFTDLEKMIFDRCRETGYSVEATLETDEGLLDVIIEQITKNVRTELIQNRLGNDVGYLKQQVSKLKAGVREPADEPKNSL